MHQSKRFFSIFSLVIFLTAFIHLSYSAIKIGLSDYTQDFQQYYEAALMIKHNMNPYQTLLTSAGPFNYPPPVLILLYPLSLLNLKTGLMIWTITSFAAYLFSLYLCFRLVGIKMPLWLKLLTIAFSLEFFPLKFTLGMGQINNFVLLFLVLSLTLLTTKRKHHYAGFFLTLAIIIKISPAIFILYILLKKKWAVLTSTFITLAVLFALSYFWLGKHIYSMYRYIFFYPLTFTDKAVYYNQSALSFFSRNFSNITAVKYGYFVFVLTILMLTFFKIKKSQSVLLDFCLILPVLLIISPISWQHHFVLLVPVFIILTAILFLKKAKQSLWLFLLLAYLLVDLNLKRPSDWPVFIQSHVFYGTFLVWLLSFFISTADQGNSTQLTVDS